MNFSVYVLLINQLLNSEINWHNTASVVFTWGSKLASRFELFNLFSRYLQPVLCVQKVFFFVVWQKLCSYSICFSFSVHLRENTLDLLLTVDRCFSVVPQALWLHVHDIPILSAISSFSTQALCKSAHRYLIFTWLKNITIIISIIWSSAPWTLHASRNLWGNSGPY